MAPSQLFFSFYFVFLSVFRTAASLRTCPDKCAGDGPIVHFPFRLTDQPERCGYPGFDVSCNRSETVLSIPNSGKFIVKNIDYKSQRILINDPDHCFPRRLLESFSLVETPFRPGNDVDFTFFNCSSNQIPEVSGIRFIDCLSIANFTVVAIPVNRYNDSEASTWSCSVISTVKVPVLWPRWSNLQEGVVLTWASPHCMTCEVRGGICGFKSYESQDMDIGCAGLPSSGGLPRSAKYGIIVGVAIPGLLCFIGLACYLCSKIRDYYERRRHSNTDFSASFTPQSAVLLTGLDGSTIESFPKILLGESGRLPKPNDNTCPICLSEYQPKEALRTIPECNHYFHADCIDEWLRMNATCPLCRNSPEGSDIITPSASNSSISSSSQSIP